MCRGTHDVAAVFYDGGRRLYRGSGDPVRIDKSIYSTAQLIAPSMGRSVSQQVSHWARLGRDLEAAGGAAPHQVAAVLGGDASHDDLDDHGGRAIVRAVWAEQIKRRREELDLDAEFAAGGRPYAELGENGRPLVRRPGEPAGANQPA